MRRPALGLLLVLAACSGSMPAEETGASETSESSGSDEGGMEDGGDGDGDGDECLAELGPETCTSAALDHSADCDVDCAITVDVEIRCDDPDPGVHGVRVAPGDANPNASLVMQGREHGWALHLDSDGGLDALVLPPEQRDRPFDLGQRDDGHLLVASSARPSACVDAAASDVVVGAPFVDAESWLVAGSTGVRRLVDFDVGDDDRWRLWTEDGAGDLFRATEGDLGLTTVTAPGLRFRARFAVGADEYALGWEWDSTTETTSLRASGGGLDAALGTPWSTGERMVAAAIPRRTTPQTDDPPLVVLAQHSDGLHLVQAGGATGVVEHVIPGTAPPPASCDFDLPCPAECERNGTGVLDWAMGAALIDASGPAARFAWVAWVETTLDQTVTLEGVCEYMTCVCAAIDVTRDDTRAELVVARVDLDSGAAEERLRVATAPLRPIVSDDTQPWLQLDEYGAFDMRAFGTRIAIGMRTRPETVGDPAVVRVVQLDGTRL